MSKLNCYVAGIPPVCVAITWLQAASKGRVKRIADGSEDGRENERVHPPVPRYVVPAWIGAKNYSRWRLREGNEIRRFEIYQRERRTSKPREKERRKRGRARGSGRRDYYRACHRGAFETSCNAIHDNALIRPDPYSVDGVYRRITATTGGYDNVYRELLRVFGTPS